MAASAPPVRPAAEFAAGIGRAFAGALLFAVPLHMTMEMWELGVSMSRARLVVLIVVTVPVLFGLSVHTGFERTDSRVQDLLDAFAAFGIGLLSSALVLALLGALDSGLSFTGIVGVVALAAVPASIGAVVANKQLQDQDEGASADDDDGTPESYAKELFLMAAGALFISIAVAPTEEMVLIAARMGPWHAVALVLASVALLHGLVYRFGFSGQEQRPDGAGFWSTFLHFSIAGYGIVLAVACLQLWVFEHIAGTGLAEVVKMATVVGFPASLGAGIARLIV